MHKPLLVVLIMVSAVSVITMRHNSRLHFGELQYLQQKRDALNTEWGRLLLEEGAWSQHQRVEKTAQMKLKMVQPDPSAIRIIRLEK